jgi:hypothetical protein
MSRLNRFAGATLSCCLAASGASFGFAAPPPDRPAPLPPERPAAAAPERTPAVQTYKARSILGTKVSIQGNIAIGTVDDIVFGDDGYIDYLMVVNDGKYVTVPWEAAKFDFDKRTALVEIPQDRYKEIPTFTAETWPNFYEPTYREKIYTYYGVKPRREIRIEKRR